MSLLTSGEMNLEEIEFYRDACTLYHTHPLSISDAVEVVLSSYIRHFGARFAEDRGVNRTVVKRRLQTFEGMTYLHRNIAFFQPALQAHGVSHTTMPVISKCLQCNRRCSFAGFEKRETYFYDLGGPGVKGKLYIKECIPCGIIYQLDGYQLLDNYKHGGGVKRMYTANNQHPYWFR